MAKKKKKQPAALRAYWAAVDAKRRPRVALDGVKVASPKKRARIRKSVRKAVRAISPKTEHGDVRFNPSWSDLKKAGKRGLHAAKVGLKRAHKAAKKSLRKSALIKSRLVQLDGVTVAPGKRRMEIINGVKVTTGATHGEVRWNPHTFPSGRKLKVERVRGKRSAEALMKKAAKARLNRLNAPKLLARAMKAKAEGKPYKRLLAKARAAKRHSKPVHGDVTKSGVHRTVKSASARLQGFTADRGTSRGPERLTGGGIYNPLVELGQA